MKTLRLTTMHGRLNPEQDMEDWGFNGPIIECIIASHSTYGHMNLFFASIEAAQKAHELTGWEWFDDNALEMRFEGDMLLLRPKDAPPAWYGDWELQTMKGDGSEVEDRPQG